MRVRIKVNEQDAKPHVVVFKDSLNALFREAGTKLGFRVSRAFLDSDSYPAPEIRSVDEISNNDLIICTAGEDCWKNEVGTKEELIRVVRV